MVYEWKTLGSTTLSVAGDTITVSGLTAKKFNNYLTNAIDNGANIGTTITLDGVGGTSYALRYNENGTEGERLNDSAWILRVGVQDQLDIGYIVNVTGQEKLMMGWHITRGGAGAGTPPNRSVFAGKFIQSGQFTEITNTNDQGGNFDTDSNLTLFGTD